MTQRKAIIIIGAIIALFAFLGSPLGDATDILYAVGGVAIVVLAYFIPEPNGNSSRADESPKEEPKDDKKKEEVREPEV